MNDNLIEETNQYLTFMLDREFFALEIGKVREVMYCMEITRIPKTPDYFKGVINLRGDVVPVIDLRHLLSIGEIKQSGDTCIIIVEIGSGDNQIQIGALADSVQEVIHIPSDMISPAPKIGTKLDTLFIQGIGKRNDHFIIILNIEKILTVENISDLKSVASVAADYMTADEQ